MKLLEVSGLGFFYGGDKFCFKDLSFELEEREILAILGLNGQGKSTLLKNLIGILNPKFGKVNLNANFAYLPQNSTFAFDYEVLDVVLMGRASGIFYSPSKLDKEKALNALNSLGISHLATMKFSHLSGGQKQLVLFARALCTEAEILFLDEPMSALDIKNQDKILTLIAKIKVEFNKSVVFTTHEPNHAFSIADKSLILFENLSYKFGKTAEILTEQNLMQLYEVEVKIAQIGGAVSSMPKFSASNMA